MGKSAFAEEKEEKEDVEQRCALRSILWGLHVFGQAHPDWLATHVQRVN